MANENVKVAVRVRSFIFFGFVSKFFYNSRELDSHSKCIVSMNEDNQTILKGNSAELADKTFQFDRSYWSFDGFKVEPNGYLAPQKGSRYIDQKKIFKDLGSEIVQNAFNGFNTTLLAYGQTGSGKSYSIMGRSPNLGLVPQICESLFTQIAERQKSNPKDEFEVTFSMIEIYNEVIRDLLNTNTISDRKGLQLHERPGRGFYILEKDLKPAQVRDFQSIVKLIERGNFNKTVAETKMNATSSRAHTIVELVFKQTFTSNEGALMQRQSFIDLVDLAGSERADKTQATGDRFKEAISINKSLSCLGKCISALAARDGSRVPYRESNLTKILMNALGGNSKTLMLATISPAESNYQESLSTLRYADRAKNIKCNAIVNQDPKDKIIRELQEEIVKLKARMRNGGGFVDDDENDRDLGAHEKEYEKAREESEEALRRQIELTEQEMDSMKRTYEEKLAEALAKAKEIDKVYESTNKKALTCAHLTNINVDAMLTGTLKHAFDFSANKRKKLWLGSSSECDIQIFGIGIEERHAAVTHDERTGEFFLEPMPNARTMRNGRVCEEKLVLRNFDRLVFGAALYYLFVDPARFVDHDPMSTAEKLSSFTADRVQQEIAEKAGIISAENGLAENSRHPDDIVCVNELVDLLPAIEEANHLSIILDRKVKYEALILNPIVIGELNAKPRPVVLVRKFGTSKEWIWDADKFIDRKACMCEMYLDFRDQGKIDDERFKKFDPFVDSYSEPVLIGTAIVEPKSILHRIPLNETSKIFDFRKKLVGNLQVEMKPCDRQGIAIDDIANSIVHEPERELSELHFLMRISNVKCISPKYKNLYCKYRLYGETEFSQTEVSPEAQQSKINYQRLVNIDKIDQNFIRYYCKNPLFIQVYGEYVSSPNEFKTGQSTRMWFEKEKQAALSSTESLREEYEKAQTELDKMRRKLKNLETLLDYAEKTKDEKRIRIAYVRECLLSTNPDVLARLYQMIGLNKD